MGLQVMQWARVRGDINCRLRRGAWYKVLALTPAEAVLQVHGAPRSIERSLLRIEQARPHVWSVVPRPADAVKLPPASWGVKYGVCPACQSRASLESLAAEQQCPHCRGLFPIDWDSL